MATPTLRGLPRHLALTFLLFVASGCAPSGPAPAAPGPVGRASLAERIDAIADQAPLNRTLWGILVQSAHTGEVLYSRNAERKFIPASNTKLVVTATAMGAFGPEHRFRTPLLIRGSEGASAEAIILVGSGDPTWSTRFHDDARAPLDSLARLILGSGVRSIGTLVVDASLFQDALVHPAWEVSDLAGANAPPIDAVAVGEGVFTLIVEGGSHPGVPARVQVGGPLPQAIRSEVVTDTLGAPTRLSIDYAARRDTIYLTGSIALGGRSTTTRALTRPAESVGEALRTILAEAGVSVGQLEVVRDRSRAGLWRMGSDLLAEWSSPTVEEIVAAILQPSQNWIAEQLLKSLGATFEGDGSWPGGVAAERRYLVEEVGLDSLSFNLRDASGMAPQNLLSPEATVGILRHALSQEWGEGYRRALAAPGLQGSTLSSRLAPLEGRLQGKTGTISNVTTLAGYLDTESGKTLLFAVYTNGTGLSSGTVREAVDAIVLEIAADR